MKLVTALTLVVATLAAAGPLSSVLGDASPIPPMMNVDIPGLLPENDDRNIKCGTELVSQRDLRHAVEWGTNLRTFKHTSGKNKYPHKFNNAVDKNNFMQGPLFWMNEPCDPTGGTHLVEFPVIKDGYYAGEDDKYLFRAIFIIVETDVYHLKAQYCGTAFRNKKALGGYVGCDLEYFWDHKKAEGPASEAQ